jgi:hypothetical protein
MVGKGPWEKELFLLLSAALDLLIVQFATLRRVNYTY